MERVYERFLPDVVVCQCGADGLAGDPMASYNLTPSGLAGCVDFLLTWQKPLLLLGGGMYCILFGLHCLTTANYSTNQQFFIQEVSQSVNW